MGASQGEELPNSIGNCPNPMGWRPCVAYLLIHRPACILLLILLTISAWAAGCSDLLEEKAPQAQTGVELKAVVTALGILRSLYGKEGGDLVTHLPEHVEDGCHLNALVTHLILQRNLMQPEGCREYGWLKRGGPEGDELLVDAWGRPIIFQVPALYPEGLTYPTAQGRRIVAPLPPAVWDEQWRGAIQVWSLGKNGVDDGGAGDDVVPR